MTRKDYIELATTLSRCRPYIAQRSTKEQRACMKVWHEARSAIMETLRTDNPNFDRELFIAATEK